MRGSAKCISNGMEPGRIQDMLMAAAQPPRTSTKGYPLPELRSAEQRDVCGLLFLDGYAEESAG